MFYTLRRCYINLFSTFCQTFLKSLNPFNGRTKINSIRNEGRESFEKSFTHVYFFKSLYSPKEIAKYRFLTIGKSIQHVFILALFLSLGGFYNMIFRQDLMSDYGETVSDAGSKGLVTIVIVITTYIFNAGLLFWPSPFWPVLASRLQSGWEESFLSAELETDSMQRHASDSHL